VTIRLAVRFDGGDPPAGARIVTRRDTYRLDKTERLPDGSLRIDAVVTRTGVFMYHDAAGNEVKEYRPPEEVQAADSISTLRDRTVTVLHPPGLVTPGNWDQYAVGHVSGEPTNHKDGVLAKLVISQADAIASIEARQLKEVSCGYQLWVEDAPGQTPTGEKYDAVQRNIRYNHVAIGPEGWGRQGSETSMRLDSKGNQVVEQQRKDTMNEITIHFDGQSYTVKVGSSEHTNLLQKIAAKDAADKARADAAEQTAKQLATVTAERDAAIAKQKELQTSLDAAPAKAREEATARINLENSAVALLGKEYKCDGIKDRDLRIAMITKVEPTFKADGKDDVYITAYCDARCASPGTSAAEDMLRRANDQKNDNRKDGSDLEQDANDPDPEKAQAKMRKDNREAASKPLAVSKEVRSN